MLDSIQLSTNDKIIFRAGVTFIGAPKFDISNSAVLIIFAQTVTWIGHYFSPLLPVVFAIVLFITFYVKKVKNLLQ